MADSGGRPVERAMLIANASLAAAVVFSMNIRWASRCATDPPACKRNNRCRITNWLSSPSFTIRIERVNQSSLIDLRPFELRHSPDQLRGAITLSQLLGSLQRLPLLTQTP